MINSHTNLLFCSFTWLLFAYSLFYIVARQTIKLCTLHHLSIRFNICVQKPGLIITVYSAYLLSLKYWFGCPSLGPFRCLQLAFKASYNQKTSAALILSLWGRYFFHVDPGNRIPACVRISRSIANTITDPESHAHSALVDFLADPFNLPYTV